MSKGKLDASLISGGSPVIGCLVVIAVVDAIVVVVGGVGGDFVVVFNVDRIVDVDLVGTVCSRRIDGVVPFGRTVVLTVGSVAAGKIQRNVSDIQRRQRANKKKRTGSSLGGRRRRRRHRGNGRPRGRGGGERLVMERADRFLVPFFLNRVFFFFFILFIVFADVVLIVGAFAGRQEVVTGLEPVERVLRRVGRVELDEERRRRRPKFGVVSDAAQVCNHRRLDVTAVVDFDAVFARQATIDNFEGIITPSNVEKCNCQWSPSTNRRANYLQRTIGFFYSKKRKRICISRGWLACLLFCPLHRLM